MATYKTLPQELKDMILERTLPRELHVAYQLCARPDKTSPGYIVRALPSEDLTTFTSLQKASLQTRDNTLAALVRHIKDDLLTLVVDLRQDLVRNVPADFDIAVGQVLPVIYRDVKRLKIVMPVAIATPNDEDLGSEDPMLWLLTLEIQRTGDDWTLVSHQLDVKLDASNPRHRSRYITGINTTLNAINHCIHRDLSGPLTRFRLERLIHVLWAGNVDLANDLYTMVYDDSFFGLVHPQQPDWKLLPPAVALSGWNFVVKKGRRYPAERAAYVIDEEYGIEMTREDKRTARRGNALEPFYTKVAISTGWWWAREGWLFTVRSLGD